MNSFIYALNSTIPIFLLILLGRLLYQLKIINDNFIKVVNQFVYYVALPVLVFSDLSTSDATKTWDSSFILFCFTVTLVSIVGLWVLAEIFVKQEQVGAFVQGSYRSSAAILGLAFIANMYLDVGNAPLMILGAVPLYNIFAVVILTIKGDNDGKKPEIKSTIIAVCKNPILIGIFLALPFVFLRIPMPLVATKTFNSLANTASPLALIAIGAGFRKKEAIKEVKPAIVASIIKLLLLATMFLPVAIYLGFRNEELVAILIMLASPTTPASYVMAKNTNNDAVLSSSIIVLTTLFSSITLTFWIFILRFLGYI